VKIASELLYSAAIVLIAGGLAWIYGPLAPLFLGLFCGFVAYRINQMIGEK